jgi:hypothetical protein
MNDLAESRSLTIREVARASGLSRRSLQEQIREGTFPNAFRQSPSGRSDNGPWRIPMGDLDAAGITIDESVLEHDVVAAGGAPLGPDSPQDELERLRAELADERTRRIVAEALAEERALALEHTRLALSALTVVSAETKSPPPRQNHRKHQTRARGNWLR